MSPTAMPASKIDVPAHLLTGLPPALANFVAPSSIWHLDPSVTFLNHGSYGAVPKVVLEKQHALRQRMEREAVRFFKVDLERLMDEFREDLGAFVGCDAADLAPMANATLAICSVLHNIDWRAGDEVLITDHEYMSGVNELERIASRTGIKIVRAAIPFPIQTPDQVFDAIMSCVTPRTRLAMVSHITSATSLIFPVERIVPALKAKGIEVLVDGAHAPGQIPVNIRALDPTYYVGSCHKWISGPKGTGFLYVSREKQANFRPVFLSSRAHRIRPERALFLRDFDYMGTDDYTGILSVPSAIQVMGSIVPPTAIDARGQAEPFAGWHALMARNHAMVLRARDILCAALGCAPAAPASMIGTMATLILPEAAPEMQTRTTLYDDPLQDELIHNHGVVTPVWRLAAGNIRVLRISAQLYNTLDQYEKLARVLPLELAREHPTRVSRLSA